MSYPNCTIVLTYFAQTTTNPTARFSYHCSASSQGWRVQPDGSIHPPSRRRVVQLNVTGYPEGTTASPIAYGFTGFQMAEKPEDLPNLSESWPPLPSGVKSLNPVTWPPTNAPSTLELEFENTSAAGTKFFYRLAVNGVWDSDPKVYNDPSF